MRVSGAYSLTLRGGTHLDRLLSHRRAADPPLGLHDALNDVARLGADRDAHRPVLVADVEADLLELGDDGDTRVEPPHAL